MTATGALEDELGAYFRAEPDAIRWPYPVFERLVAAGGVRWEDGPALVVGGYDQVKSVMSGSLPFANDAYRYGAMAEATIERIPAPLREPLMGLLDFESLFMSRKDGAEHQRLRRIASRAFTARRVGQLEESIRRHVEDLLTPLLERGHGDFKQEVADQLPTRVITDLLGVPDSDRQMIWDWSQAVAAFFTVDAGTVERAQQAVTSFRGYVDDVIAQIRRTGEGPELAKTLLGGHADNAMTEEELVAMYLLLLFGGSETTTNLLGNGFHALQRHRDQWEALVRDPSGIPDAVEEVFRWDAPHQYLPRYATADVELGRHRVSQGDTVILVHAAANRDPSVFPDPQRFDITRPNAKEHLSLAFGPHFCLGAALARLEGRVVFEQVLRRMPQAHLDAVDLAYTGSALLRSIVALPVEVGATCA